MKDSKKSNITINMDFNGARISNVNPAATQVTVNNFFNSRGMPSHDADESMPPTDAETRRPKTEKDTDEPAQQDLQSEYVADDTHDNVSAFSTIFRESAYLPKDIIERLRPLIIEESGTKSLMWYALYYTMHQEKIVLLEYNKFARFILRNLGFKVTDNEVRRIASNIRNVYSIFPKSTFLDLPFDKWPISKPGDQKYRILCDYCRTFFEILQNTAKNSTKQ